MHGPGVPGTKSGQSHAVETFERASDTPGSAAFWQALTLVPLPAGRAELGGRAPRESCAQV